jgi:type II secretory pathway pseudopilin PulG
MTMGPGRSETGSAVVEAMVAVAILAMVLGVGFRGLADGARASRQAEATRLATLEARSRLASVGGDIPLEPGTTQGEDAGMDWRVDVNEDPAPPSSVDRLLRAEAVVSDRQGRVRARLATVKLAPPG